MEQALNIPYDWQGLDFTPRWEDEETGEIRWGVRKYRIFVWGHDQHNDPVCWIVDDYMPHLYVKIEDKIGESLQDEESVAPLILEALNQNLKDYVREKSNEPRHSHLKGLLRLDQIILNYMPEDRLPMFYYKTEKHRVYKVFFQLEATMHLCHEYLDRRKIKMPNGIMISAKAYNNGESDRIPTEAKLLVERKLDRCGWMFANAWLKQHDGLTTLEKEYTVSYRDLTPVPQAYALQLGFPKPSTISFDSETFSKVFTRFPKASRLSDEMYAAGFRHRVYSGLGCKTPKVTNYIFVIWDPAKYGELKDYSKEYGDSIYVYCRDEIEFLCKLFEYIQKLDPTFIIGYNQLGFDWDYVEQRCEIFGIKPPNLSRIRGWYKSQFIRKNWKKFSFAWPQYPGRMDVDMLAIARINQIRAPSFKLKDVAKVLLPAGHTKVELPYKEQFRIYAAKERDGMDRIMDYLHMDILLPEELYDKLSISVYLHTNGSVMKTNPFMLYTEGQSTRCIGQLYEQVVEDGMYVNSRTIWKAGKYIGGLVFDQIAGIYENVVTFDWNSLYPSEMKVNNICYSSLIDEKVDGDKYRDEDCHVVEGDVPIVDKKTKELVSMDHHKFRYIKKTTRMGLLPKIVIKLNALRSEYKKEMDSCYGKAKTFKKDHDTLKSKWATEPTTNETELIERKSKLADLLEQYRHWQGEGDIWNVKQMAVKVSANSMYGFMGMKTGKFSFIEGGMSTTLAGRGALRKTLDIVTNHFGAKLVYGDSVTGKTPLLVRLGGVLIHLMTIEELYAQPGRLIQEITGKEYKELNDDVLIETWTDKGWTRIRNVMRHKTTKKIYRVLTNTGYVEVTEDHSLLRDDGQEITPKTLKIGDALLQSYPPSTDMLVSTHETDEDIAFAMGFFVADGSCGKYGAGSNVKYSWAINNKDMGLLEYVRDRCESKFRSRYGCGLKILDTLESSNVYKLVPTENMRDITLAWRRLFYSSDKSKVVPSSILFAPLNIKQAFFRGFYAGDGDKTASNGVTIRFDTKNQLSAASYYYLLKSMGFNISLNNRRDKQNIFRLTASKKTQRKKPNLVKKIELLTDRPEEIYVYDLTTENHHFQAGIGNIIVHNTDSVMVQFPADVINVTNYKKKLREIADYISSQFPEGMNIAPENFFLKFFTITKKRYAAIKINPERPDHMPTETEVTDQRLLYVKGLISVRGNSCGIVYDNFNPILIKMLLGVPVQQLFEHIHQMALKIMRREYDLEDYILRQKLGADYKNKSSEMAVFSDCLKQKGRTHKPGEELEFVYAKTNVDCLKGFKMQTPDLFVENGNVLDTMYYLTNKIAKPVEQLLTCVYDDSVLKPTEKKKIRPRKPTSVQKVTPHWHLELYIRKLIASLHADWEMVQNEIKLIREIAEQRGIINYIIDETRVVKIMKERYGVDWVPYEDLEKVKEAEKKQPVHRHAVWKAVQVMSIQ